MKIFLKTFCVCLALITLSFGTAQAANFELSGDQLCQIRLNGEIVSGDKAKLEKLVKEAKVRKYFEDDGESTSSWRMCLSSPGGSLSEAAEISEYIFETGIGTVIEKNQKCMSACSWVFMMGFTRGVEEINYTNRRMHFTSTLGFHAPSLNLDGYEILTREEVERALKVMNKAVYRLLKLSNSFELNGEFAVASDLLEEAFKNDGAEQFYLIDSVNKAGRWRIPIFGIEWPSMIDISSGVRACNNLTRWKNSLNDGASIEVDQYPLNQSKSTEYHLDVFGSDSGYFGHRCKLSRKIVKYGDQAYINICGENQSNGSLLGDISCLLEDDFDEQKYHSYPAVSILPASTKLKNIPAELKKIDRRARLEVAALENRRVKTETSCVLGYSHAKIVNVNQFVNIRAGASLADRVVATANRGQRVQVVQPNSWWFKETKRGRQCSEICSRYHQTPTNSTLASQAKQCVDDKEIWTKVRVNGREGYVSVYFLEAQ